jgi:hypothetical protein
MGETTLGKRKMLYITPDQAARDRGYAWQDAITQPVAPGSNVEEYVNQKNWLRPIGPGDRLNLQDDEGAQSLQDAMRLRMQLPR